MRKKSHTILNRMSLWQYALLLLMLLMLLDKTSPTRHRTAPSSQATKHESTDAPSTQPHRGLSVMP